MVVGIWVCLLIASQLVTNFTYNRWDNFEYNTTILVEAHSQLLKGIIPFWNHHQLLGEPILANGIPSALYFPYTVLIAIMRILGLPDERFTLLVVLTHFPLMGLGWFLLMRFIGIRASLAWLGAISIPSSGYMTTFSAVWIFVCPIFTWLPWILLGVLHLLLSQRPISGLFLVTFGLTAISYVIHPQFIAYAWFFVLLFAFLISHFWLRKWQALSRLILPALSAVLLSAPAILPVVSLFPYTARASSFSMEAFLHRPAYRVLPLSWHRWIRGQPSAMQQHGLFHSATANNYYSLTGTTSGMAPKWYLRHFPSNEFGLLPRQIYDKLLSSHFLRTLNVRYLIVAKDDKETIKKVERKYRYEKMKELERVFVYEDPGALSRAYFADQIKPYSEYEFLKGLVENNDGLETAFVEGVNGNQVWAQGKVKSAQWLDGGRVVLDLEAPRGGFLVVSQTYFPQWKAFVDGTETPIFRVNGIIQGVKVDPGASRVELVWKSTAFVLGCWLAAIGMILLIVVAYRRKYSLKLSGS